MIYKDFSLSAGGEQSFEFVTHSKPATAVITIEPYLPLASADALAHVSSNLLEADEHDLSIPRSNGNSLATIPQSPLAGAQYKVRIDRVSPSHSGDPGCDFPFTSSRLMGSNCGFLNTQASGIHSFALEDYSEEAARATQVRWRVAVTHRTPRKQVRYRLYVQDVRMNAEHAERMSYSAQCSFVGAWKKFNTKHQGMDEVVALNHDESLVHAAIFLSLGFIVFAESRRRKMGTGNDEAADVPQNDARGRLSQLEDAFGSSKMLVQVQVVKFLIVDFPVQLALVNYLLSWY